MQDVGRLITVDADCLGMEEPEEAPRNPLQAKRRRRAPTKVKRLRDIGTLSENIPVSGETSEGSQSAGGKRKPAGAGQAGMPAPKKPKMSAPQDDDSSAWEPTAEAPRKKVLSPSACAPDLAAGSWEHQEPQAASTAQPLAARG